MTTRGSSGHVGPLTPFGHACLHAGHEVLVAAQRQFQGNVERARLPFAPVAEPPKEQWMPLMGAFSRLSFEAANAQMIGEFFGRMDTAAALPDLTGIVEDWRPDVIVRESWEFGGALVAEPRRALVRRAHLQLDRDLEQRSQAIRLDQDRRRDPRRDRPLLHPNQRITTLDAVA